MPYFVSPASVVSNRVDRDVVMRCLLLDVAEGAALLAPLRNGRASRPFRRTQRLDVDMPLAQFRSLLCRENRLRSAAFVPRHYDKS